jgi:hypothetical protein
VLVIKNSNNIEIECQRLVGLGDDVIERLVDCDNEREEGEEREERLFERQMRAREDRRQSFLRTLFHRAHQSYYCPKHTRLYPSTLFYSSSIEERVLPI